MIANIASLLVLNFLVGALDFFSPNPIPFSVVMPIVIFDELNFTFHSVVPLFLKRC